LKRTSARATAGKSDDSDSGAPFSWTGLAAAQVFFDAGRDERSAQDPSATLWGLLTRLVEVAPGVGPASRQGDLCGPWFLTKLS
jgi:hypothetical protein